MVDRSKTRGIKPRATRHPEQFAGQARLLQVMPAQLGTYAVHVMDASNVFAAVREPIIGWAVYDDGSVKPVFRTGIEDNDHAVLFPDGTVDCFFESYHTLEGFLAQRSQESAARKCSPTPA